MANNPHVVDNLKIIRDSETAREMQRKGFQINK